MGKKTPSSRATSKKSKRKKRKINRFRVVMLLFFLVFLITVVFCAILWVSSNNRPADQQSTDANALFGIKHIVVEGNSRYTDSQIIEVGNVYKGQSIFFINKRRVAQNILQTFPYIDKVSVSNPSFSSIKISIKETQPVGIVSHKLGWLIIGDNGKGLELLDSSSLRVLDYRLIKCQAPSDKAVGSIALDSRTMAVINAVFSAASDSVLDAVIEVDVTDLTNISLNWKSAINIKLGKDTNLDSKLSYACKALNKVLGSHGGDAAGQIDLSIYSDTSPKAVFTPKDLLTQKQPNTNESTSSTTSAAE